MRQKSLIAGFAGKDSLTILFLAFLSLISVFVQGQEIQGWGNNNYGQINIPSSLSGVIGISGGLGHTIALRHNGTVKVTGLLVADNAVTDVTTAVAGGLHVVALKADGTVVAWGFNTDGQINVPAGLANVKAVAAGFSHSLALKADGTVVAWGSNAFGQTAVPVALSNVIAISAGAVHSMALRSDGTVVVWGPTSTVPGGLNNVIAIDGGGSHSVALKSDGTVVAWGNNSQGQCNVPLNLNNVIAISAGNEHTVALRGDGSVVAWGGNNYGQATVPPGLTGVVEIATGLDFTLVRKGTGTRLNVWGSSLSTLTSPSFNISGIKAVAAGRTAGLALNADGTVTAWGTGGIVTGLPANLTHVKAIGAGMDHATALKVDGTVVSWGSNTFGERVVPGGLTGVKAIAVGAYHNVAIKADGTVVNWGNDAAEASFPSSLSNAITVAAGSTHCLALKADGTVAGWGGNTAGQRTVPGDLTNVTDIAGGNSHSLALKSDGKVQGWGDNSDGQYSFPSSLANVKAISAGEVHSVALKADGTMDTRGVNGTSSSTVPAGLNAVIDIDSQLKNNISIVVDQPPVISGAPSSGVVYVEGGTALRVQNTITLTDNGHTSLAGATVSIANGFVTGDQLAVTVSGGVASNYDQATGVLTLTGSATIATYQTILRSLTYESVSAAPALNATRTISVTASDGTQSATPLTYTINITPVNDAPSFSVISSLITDEDAPAISLNWVSGISAGPADEAGQTLTIQVENDNNSLFSIQPAVSSSGRLTFTLAANAYGTATVTVRLIDDGGTLNGGIDRRERTFSITVNSVNDAPSFTKGADVVVNEDIGAQMVNNWATAITAGPADESAQTVTFSVNNDNTGLFASQPLLDAAGTLTFTPASDRSGVANVTVVLRDNGGTVFGGVNQSSQTFTITITPVNDAPSFVKGSDIVINEDAGTQTINAWASSVSTGANEFTQTVSFQVSNDNSTLFSVQPSVNASGDLSFTPAPDAFGVATITLSIHDNGGTTNGGIDRSAGQTFTITINAVNDAPSFVKGSDVVVNEDAPGQTINAWASAISAGPHESAQTMSFQISNDNNTLFSVQPSVSTSGGLSFTPAPDVSGVAIVTLSLHDSGGTTNGGVNQSVDQTFTITVNAVNDAPSFTKGNDITVDEDAPEQIIHGWATNISAGPESEAGQALTFVISADNQGLFSVQPSLTAAGDLTFTPAPEIFGSATVTVSLTDNGGTAQGGTDRSADHRFTITIEGINDAPSFVKGGDVTVNEDAAPYSQAWATLISAGDIGQSVTFTVSAVNTGLFAVQPSISASGVLSFEVQPDAHGSSTVTVYLRDNGGTASGGIDESQHETFNIIVKPVNDAPLIDPIDDITVPVNSAPVIVTLTGIHPGAGEDDQHLMLVATPGDQTILSKLEMSAVHHGSATLTLVAAPGVTGTTILTIKVRDNGGTLQGGKDETLVSFTLTVEEHVQPVFIPNFFSPNSNGMNDVFRVRGAGIAQIQFRVYDINGLEVFSTTDVTQATETGWNGTCKGRDLPAGTYIWTLQGRYIDGKPLTTKQTQHGQVILTR